MRQTRSLLVVWVALLAILGLQLATTLLHAGAWAPALVFVPAGAMIALVGFGFLRLGSMNTLSKAFVVAGLLWITILLCLTSVDRLTRTDYPVPISRYP